MRVKTSAPIVWFVFIVFGFLGACSIPNLEADACIEARPFVREFYSYHFAHEMALTPEGLKERERFLTSEHYEQLRAAEPAGDPFTVGKGELPRAFRPGRCEIRTDGRAAFHVLLFWKDDERTEQHRITTLLKNVDDKWLVDEIEN